MTHAAIGNMNDGEPAPAGGSSSSPPPPRSFTARVVRQTFAGWGAVLGAVWVGVLAFLAVFSPFLANTHPLLLKMNGRWSMPALRYATPADVTLLVSTLVIAVLLSLRRIRPGVRAAIAAGMIILTIVLTIVFIQPPQTVVYEQYREASGAGKIQFAIYAPIRYSPTDRLRDNPEMRLTAPSLTHLMGTESDGADLLSRMIHASRIALAIGFIATSIAVVLGVLIGGFMGYFSRTVDLIGMRLVEIFEAIPTLFLLLACVAAFGRNLYIMMAIIGLTSWTGYARFIRAEFLKLRQQDFVQAAIACGLPLRSILFKHMLPNGIAPVLVGASFGVASAILFESTLSFLGLGLVDEPSWGGMLEQARGVGGTFYWWMALFPGLAIFLTVFAYNLVGEALRDAIDPHVSRNQ